jgi:hypothetical protein
VQNIYKVGLSLNGICKLDIVDDLMDLDFIEFEILIFKINVFLTNFTWDI